MAVNIPISASAGGVTAALREIQDAINRSGQSAKAFKDIDLSHPELRSLANEIRSVQAKFEDLARVGRGATAQAVRSFTGSNGINLFGPNGFATGGLNAVYPNPAAAQRVLQQAGNYAFQGTRWQGQQPAAGQPGQPGAAPPPPPPVGSGGGGGHGGGGGGGGIGGMIGSAVGMAGPFALAGLALAGIGSIKHLIGSAVTKGQEESIGNENLLRRMDDGAKDYDTPREVAASYETLREAIRKTADSMGVAYSETQRLSMTWAKLTNDSQAGTVSAGVKLGIGLSRSYGMDPASGVQALGQASYQGLDEKKFALLIGESVRAGGQSGQVEQVMQALLHWSEGANRQMISQSHEREFASMYSGMNATDNPGMKGANAEAIIGTLNSSLSRGGAAGMASQALTYRALSREGITDPYDIKMMTEGGMFATGRLDTGRDSNYKSDKTLLTATMEELKREYSGQPRNRLLDAVSNHTGLNMRQSDALLDMKPADLSRGQQALDAAQINLKDVDATGIKSIVDIAQPNADLESWRSRLMARTGAGSLSADEKTQLSGASGEDLRTLMVQLVGRHGQEATEGSETRASLAKLDNSLAKVGSDLLTPLNAIRDFASSIVGEIGDVGSILTNVWKAGTGDVKAIASLLGIGGGGAGAGSVGQAEPGITDAIRKDRAQQAIDWFQSPAGGGFSRSAALGLAAGAQSESNFEAHGKKGDGGTAAGLYQWHPDRQAAIKAHFGKAVDDMDYSEQLRAKTWELSASGPEAPAGKTLRGATSPYKAGYLDTTQDQRPAYSWLEGEKRGWRADALDKQFPEGSQQQPPAMVHVDIDVHHKDAGGAITHTERQPTVVVPAPKPWGEKGAASPEPMPPPAHMVGPVKLAPLRPSVTY